MKIRLRKLELRIVTAAGLFGVRIPFGKGLLVLRAGNSRGKSTCVQAILYALGLEAMLGASHNIPLPPAMTHEIADDDGKIHRVLESSVLLEFENQKGDVLTVQRPVISDSENRRLIKTWLGPKLTNPKGDYKQLDRFVRIEGAVQRPDGFHHMLARFLEWEMPQVLRHQGPPCPLYLECIFPLLVIEQKHGWSGIQARMPTHLGIREIGKRATEFLLNLDEYSSATARQLLEQEATALKTEWTATTSNFAIAARMAGGAVKDLPSQPVADWPSPTPPQVLIPTENGQQELAVFLAQEEEVLRQLEKEEIPRVEQVAQELATSLAQAQKNLAETDLAIEALIKDIQNEQNQLSAIDERLEALEEDLQKNRDTQRLRELGSNAQLNLWEGNCPTCHQPVTDSLFERGPQPMSVADNIGLIEEQIRTFKAMRADSKRVVTAKDRRLAFLRQKLDELRSLIRTQKRSLTSDARAPSEAAIQARLQLEDRIRQLHRATQEIERVSHQLNELASRWRKLQERTKLVAKSELSESDNRKLQLLQKLLIDQLQEYGFSSMAPSSIRISQTTYRPEHEGFDLGFDLSASDMIRTIWAYIHGLLELSRTEQTNHPGLLILDEPRQQETARVDFASFLKRASSAGKAEQQVIFATSEEPGHLRSVLKGLPHTFIEFEGRILKRMEADR
jgi:hypothetical protein